MKDSYKKGNSSLKGPNKTDTDIPGTPVSTATRPNCRRSTPGSPLPTLGIIRRGSMCDVKTFKSSRVLDFLSKYKTCEMKNRHNLEVELEELKYCRYLRLPSPSDQENTSEHSEGIPTKYQPSKNIVIGHTKVSSLL